jgi:hypothetical protein
MKMTAGGFDILREEFGKLNKAQVTNINLIIESCNKHKLEYNQAAYVLATAWHETDQTMLPVIEAYWLSENWRKKNLRYYPYYGRGFVQLTWDYNYKKAAIKLGLEEDAFLKEPSLVQRVDYAAEIIVLGSLEGWFTGVKLQDYITKTKREYKPARSIINGFDKAQKIADEAEIFEKALRAI